eukprot:g63177.t1
MLPLFLGLSILWKTALAGQVKGVISLDTITIGKVVDGSRPVLVKVDETYAYGEKEDAFKQLAERCWPSKLLVGSVGVQNYGDKLNEDFAERYGVKKEDYPVYLLFKEGQDVSKPLRYSGKAESADAIMRWVVENTGLFIGLPGQLGAFDELARTYLSKPNEEKKEVLKKAEELATAVSAGEVEYANFYVRVMKKVLEEGSSFIKTETTRIGKLLQGKLREEKKKSFENRLNILPSFKQEL